MDSKKDLTLIEIINKNDYIIKYGTDKESKHKYCSAFYEKAFYDLKDKKLNILEIGIQQGSSLVLWNEYFKNSIVYGIDNSDFIKDRLDTYPRIKTIIQDAYKKKLTFNLPFFDIIIDDGPHTLESQIKFINNYFKKLNKKGTLYIEDIDGSFNLDKLIKEASKFTSNIKSIDFRSNTNTGDSLMLVIQNDLDMQYLVN
jgi:hypothetical protein